MIRRLSLISVLVVCVLLSGVGMSAAQEEALQIALPLQALSYVVSPDGTRAALFPNLTLLREEPPNADATVVRIVDLVTVDIVQTLSDLPDWTSDAAFLPDGRLLTAHANGDFILWDADGARERQWWTGLYQSRIRMSPDGSLVYVMVPGVVTTMLEMDLETGALMRALGRHPATLFELIQGQSDIERRGDYNFVDFTLSTDGTSLAYANADGALFAMDITNQIAMLVRPPAEQPMAFNVRSLRFAPDSETLFYLQYERDVRQVMRVTTDGEVIASYGANVVAYALSPDGSSVAWVERAEDGSRVLIQDLAGSEATVIYNLTEANLAVSPIPTLSFALGGSRLLLDVATDSGDSESAILLVLPVG